MNKEAVADCGLTGRNDSPGGEGCADFKPATYTKRPSTYTKRPFGNRPP